MVIGIGFKQQSCVSDWGGYSVNKHTKIWPPGNCFVEARCQFMGVGGGGLGTNVYVVKIVIAISL